MDHINKNFTKSVTFKLMSIGIIILVLLYPKFRIQNLISERESSRILAENDVSNMWGGEQILEGPVMIIPYWNYENRGSDIIRRKRQAKFLPEKLKIDGEIFPEKLDRSIYEVIVYTSDLDVKGTLKKPDFDKLGISEKEVIWEEAQLQISVSDIRGIRENIVISWNDRNIEFEPGVMGSDVFQKGLSIPLNFTFDQDLYEFSFNMKLNGSKNLSFLPLANETKVKIKSNWNSPSLRVSMFHIIVKYLTVDFLLNGVYLV